MMPIRTHSSLNRDFTLLSLFILFVVLIVSAWIAYETYEQHAGKIIEQMERDSARIDHELTREIAHHGTIVESIGRQIAASNASDLSAIAQLFRAYDKKENLRSPILSWLDKDQLMVVNNALGVLSKPVEMSDRDYVKRAITEPWRVHLGTPIEGRLSQRWILPLSMAITNESGDLLGIIMLGMDIGSLEENIRTVLDDPRIDFALTNFSLTLITESQPEDSLFSRVFRLNELAKLDFRKDQQAIYSRASLWQKHTHFAYYQTSKRFPLVIFLTYDRTKSSEMVSGVLFPRLFQLMVVAAFLLFVLWTVRRRIIYPVIQLTQRTAQAVRGEKFDPSYQTGPMEIQLLASEILRLWQFIEERRRVENELRLKNSDLIRLREVSQSAAQMKADFYGIVGQELGAPLMAIKEIASHMEQSSSSTTDQEAAGEVLQYCQQLLVMLQEIKSVADAESGMLAMHDQEIALGDMLPLCLRLFEEANTRGVKAQLDLNSPLPTVKADASRLKQILLNILQVASMHLSSGDVIRVSSNIRAGDLNLLFAYTSAPSSASKPRNSGLGIAMVRLLSAMHQASVETKTTADRISVIVLRMPATRIL